MAIHAVDIACAPDAPPAFVGEANSWLTIWLTNYQAWEPGEARTQANQPPELVGGAEGIPEHYYGGIWRFELAENYETMLQNLVGYANAYAPWFRVRYHICTHDEGAPAPCSWEGPDSEIHTGGTVPDGV